MQIFYQQQVISSSRMLLYGKQIIGLGLAPSAINDLKTAAVGGNWNSKISSRIRHNNANRLTFRSITVAAAVDETVPEVPENAEMPSITLNSSQNGTAVTNDPYPSEHLNFSKTEGWQSFLVKLRMLIAFPWQRVKKGSIFKLKISGEVTEQVQGRFTQGLSLPQICQNIIKAAHDPRISGMIVQVEPLSCGWGKIDEICRHINYYKQSGKILVGYLPVGGEKEYYLACACGEIYSPPGAYVSLLGLKVQASFLGGVLAKVGVEPQIERLGKYKSFGDLLSRKDMSDANREMLTAILDDVYRNWLHRIASFRGKSASDVELLLDEGIFEIERLKEMGWITDVKYVDEIEDMLKHKLGLKGEEHLKYVDYRKYSRVKEWTLGLSGGKESIAVLRAVGSISRVRSGLGSIGGSGIASDTFIEQIRQVRDNKNYKAVVLRIDSPGGDALASDLMWRELRLLAAKKPVVASMVDVAASGGYYMAMAAGVIVAESLTLTGSIGVVTGKFNLKNLYERLGFSKEIISRGKFAELDAEQRPFKKEEAEFFAKSAERAYKSFRDKAAYSRSLEISKMEEVAQGRVWTGEAALGRGLVDSVGGYWKAVAIAKEKAGIAVDSKVKLVELSKRQPSLTSLLLRGVMGMMTSIDSSPVQAFMDTNISIEGTSSQSSGDKELIASILAHILSTDM